MKFGLALIGGLLTWLNRHGGCASRTKDRRRHDTYNDFNVNNHQDLESNKMGYHHQDNTSSPHINNTNSMVNSNNNNPGASPLSPFQRRLVPATGQTTGYMNLGDDDYSETSSGLMNQNQPVYPATTQPGMYDYSKTEYNSYEMDAWQHQQQQQQHHHQPQQQYYNTAPSPHIQNMAQMKPDTIDHKPNEI
ncbi:hypothetical protein BJ944DRAFT_91386 [Cunninghamella echinulata]|nr:hypothetical protein BJ944DRAFT_91386 [Cunninghamella echinulata]